MDKLRPSSLGIAAFSRIYGEFADFSDKQADFMPLPVWMLVERFPLFGPGLLCDPRRGGEIW